MTGSAAGVDLAHDDTGRGPVVVLLHAFPCTARLWDDQRRVLVADGWRVVTPDLRGFGRSPLGDAPPSLDVMADDVLRLLAALDVDRFVLGGLSMGGYVAMALLRRAPELVAGLVLADTKASADTPAAREGRLALATQVQEGAPPGWLAERLVPGLLGDTTRRTRPDVVAEVTSWVDRAAPASVAWAQRAMAERPDSVQTLAQLEVPTLVLWGDEDVLSPRPDQEAMLAVLARGTPWEIAGSGHLSAVERPAEVSRALVDFVTPLRAPYV